MRVKKRQKFDKKERNSRRKRKTEKCRNSRETRIEGKRGRETIKEEGKVIRRRERKEKLGDRQGRREGKVNVRDV